MSLRIGFQLLRRAWKPVLLFELLWKAAALLLLLPMLGGLLRLLLSAAGLKYLTNANLLSFLRAPTTWLGVCAVLLTLALYSLFELSAVISCYYAARRGLPCSVPEMLRTGLFTLRRFFRKGSPGMLVHLLLLLPVMQFSVLSGGVTLTGVPDLFSYYLMQDRYLLPGYLLLTALCLLLTSRSFLTTALFTVRRLSFRSARQKSRRMTKGKSLRVLGSVSGWNLLHLIALTLLLCLVSAVLLVLSRKTGNGSFWNLFSARFLRLIVRSILLLFFCAAIPIAAAHMTALYSLLEAEDIPEASHKRAGGRVCRHILRRIPGKKRLNWSILCCAAACAAGLHILSVQGLLTGNFPLRLSAKPQITAHRGFSAAAPENTLYAFEAAIEAGADCIELDVQQTKDGVPVVIHDAKLTRTAGKNQTVRSMTYAELSQLDVGSWFSPRYADARIPRLEEVLELAQGRVSLNIEIKNSPHTAQLEQDVADLITEYELTGSCCVTSFSYQTLQRIKAANPDISTGYLMSLAFGDFYTLEDADAFSVNKLFVTRQMVIEAHRNGKAIFAWTVNSASELQSLKQMQVDDVITDRPLLAKEIFSQEIPGNSLLAVLEYLIH